MPQLTPYQSTQAAPVKPNTYAGEGSFGMNISQPIEQFGAALVERGKENEATKVTAAMAEAQAALTVAQEKAFLSADPNDETVGQRFLDTEMTPLLDKIGESISSRFGRVMYDRARAGLEANFKVNTAAKQANLSGVAEEKNYNTTKNMLSNSAKLNPGNLEQSLALAEDYEIGVRVRGVVDQATLKTLGKDMRREIAMGAVTGMADKGQFDAAENLLNGTSLDAHLDASDKETLQANIRTARATAAAEANAAAAQARRDQEATFAAASNAILNKQPVTDKGLGLYSGFFKDAQDLPAETAEQVAAKRAMINYGKSLLDASNGDTWKEDQPTLGDLWKRAYLAPGDPDKLTVAEVQAATGNRFISPATATNLFQAITGEDDPTKREAGKDIEQFIDGYTTTISRSGGPLGVIDTTGNQRLKEFEEQARQIFRDGQNAKVPMEQIKERIRSILPRYQRSGQEIADSLQAWQLNQPIAPLPRVAPQRWMPNSPVVRGFPENLTQGAGVDLGPDAAFAAEGLADMIEPPINDPTDHVQNPFDFNKYPPVQNADGSMSHIITKSWSFAEKDPVTGELADVHVLLPTMIGGKKLTDDQAIDHYLNTGEYFRKFKTAKAAAAFADALEREMQHMNTQRGTPAATRAKSGESPGDYLKRLGL